MRAAPQPRAGFALPAVLGLVALLSLVLLAAATALTAMTASARRALDEAEFERAAMGAEARALVLVATTPFAPDGLRTGPSVDLPESGARRPVIRLDGRAYSLPGAAPLTVALQDEAGLVNLDASRPDALLRLLATLRLPQAEAETLRDRLLDALDADTRTRPRGMEAADYRAAGLRPPPPGGFADLAELAAVPGWEALAAGARRRDLAALATADPGSSGFNLNTAPAAALQIVLGVGSAESWRLLALRDAAPLRSLAQAGLPPGSAGEGVRPSGRVRFTATDTRRGLGYVSRLAFDDAPGGPPWIAAGGLLTREVERTPADAAALPDATAAPAAR